MRTVNNAPQSSKRAHFDPKTGEVGGSGSNAGGDGQEEDADRNGDFAPDVMEQPAAPGSR